MPTLTPAERRAVLMVVAILALGAARDFWRAGHPRLAPPFPADGASAITAIDPDRHDPKPGAPEPDPKPVLGPAARADSSGAGAFGHATASGRAIDINHADAIALDALPGVGPVLARRIVEHRSTHGPYRRVEDLRAVRGIGPKLLERLRPYVRIGP
jgi:competence ComEA-like helix-hairpin-helix protein